MLSIFGANWLITEWYPSKQLVWPARWFFDCHFGNRGTDIHIHLLRTDEFQVRKGNRKQILKLGKNTKFTHAFIKIDTIFNAATLVGSVIETCLNGVAQFERKVERYLGQQDYSNNILHLVHCGRLLSSHQLWSTAIRCPHAPVHRPEVVRSRPATIRKMNKLVARCAAISGKKPRSLLTLQRLLAEMGLTACFFFHIEGHAPGFSLWTPSTPIKVLSKLVAPKWSEHTTKHPAGLKLTRCIRTKFTHFARSLFTTWKIWRDIPAFVFDRLLPPCTSQREDGMANSKSQEIPACWVDDVTSCRPSSLAVVHVGVMAA